MNVLSTTDTQVTPGDDLAFLNTVMLFHGVPEKELQHIMQIMRHENFSSGAIILREGEPTNDLLIIREGFVSVYVDRDHKKIEICRLGATSYFGEMSIFDDYPRSANVEAGTDVRTLRIDRDAFRTFIRANPSALYQMCTVFSHRLRNTNSVLAKR